MITQTLVLQMVPTGIKPTIHISQGDTGEKRLRFMLISGSTYFEIPAGTLAYFLGTKRDGKPFEYAATWSGHIVEVDVTEQMSNVPGIAECELRLMKADSKTVLGSTNLLLVIERSPLHQHSCSKAELKSIDNALVEAHEMAERAEAAADSAEASAAAISLEYVSSIEQLLLNKTS